MDPMLIVGAVFTVAVFLLADKMDVVLDTLAPVDDPFDTPDDS